MARTLKIKYVERSKLIPYVNNARTHSESQIKQIAASIREFGFTNPILVDENNGIIAGHGRLEAAAILEIDKVPTITLAGLSDAQRRAYVIADNKLALNADWSMELLGIEMELLRECDFDIETLGFSENELGLIEDGWTSDITPPSDTLDPERFVLRVSGVIGDELAVKDIIQRALVEFDDVQITS